MLDTDAGDDPIAGSAGIRASAGKMQFCACAVVAASNNVITVALAAAAILRVLQRLLFVKLHGIRPPLWG